MQSFGEYIAEAKEVATRQEELMREIEKLGYNKFQSDASFRLFVYVLKSERKNELNTIADKLSRFGAYTDTSDTGQKEGKSSIGTIRFKKGPFEGQMVSMKPSAEKDLTTDEQESLHAYFTALKLKDPNTNFTVNEFKNVPVESAFTAEHLISKAAKGWITSATFCAERLYKTFKGKEFVICQRSKSKFVDNISKAANGLLKKAGKEMLLDKWNPADMWMVHPTLLNTDFTKFESIYDLNTWIQDNYMLKKLVGVSLKKTDKNVKAEIKNFRAAHKPIVLSGMDVGKTGLTKSIQVNIYFNKTNTLVIRAFKRMSPASGELTGRLAAGGKVGNGPLEKIVKECLNSRFKFTTDRQIIAAYDKNKEEIYKYALDLAKKVDKSVKFKLEDFIAMVETGKYKSSPKSYLISKIQALEVAAAIKSATKKKVECALEQMVSFAGSTTDVSSVFVKVH